MLAEIGALCGEAQSCEHPLIEIYLEALMPNPLYMDYSQKTRN